jgi:4-nitrophenyl phosphatase
MMDVARPGSKVYVIGEEGIREALEQHGFLLGDEGAEYVVVGWDRAVTWDKLATASVLIRDGADFIGTNPDVTYPTERGPVPGTGALLAAIETATGVAPIVTGKPQFRMYKEAMRRMAATPDTTAMIGDRLDTDIAGALRAGITAVLTLSGITTEDDLRQSTVRPDLVFADIRALLACWRNQVR